MTTLELPVNKFFFDQVKNKELIEDYRAIKPFWIKKLIKKELQNKKAISIVQLHFNGVDVFKRYDRIIFKNGYSDKSPKLTVIFEDIRFTQPHEITCMGQGIAFAIKISYKKMD